MAQFKALFLPWQRLVNCFVRQIRHDIHLDGKRNLEKPLQLGDKQSMYIIVPSTH